MITETLPTSTAMFWGQMLALWGKLQRLSHRAPRRLRLCESLPLGERRFVAVVEFERTRFLLGGTPSSLVLLSRLSDEDLLADKKAKLAEEDAGWVDQEKDKRGRGC
jgi:flagellar biogenesis protein FliO